MKVDKKVAEDIRQELHREIEAVRSFRVLKHFNDLRFVNRFKVSLKDTYSIISLL